MNDEERIRMYYVFGTTDCASETARSPRERGKNGGIRNAVRFLKLATLLGSLVFKNMSVTRINKK